jgi:hypothetical protein
VSYSYDLSFWAIEKRDRPKPYRLRWSVAGRRPPFSRSFLTAELAESFKAELRAAARRGEGFDEATGLPDSVLRRDRDITWYQHAQEYAATRWNRSAGNSRRSIVESLTCVTQVLTRDLRGRPDPRTLRAALRKDLNQGREKSGLSAEESKAITWLKRASLPISALNDDEVVIDVLDALASRIDGTPAAPDYYARRFRVTRTCLSYAVRKKRIPKNPLLAANLPGHWTPPKADDAVDPRSVGSPQLVADMLTIASYVGARQGPRFAAFYGCMFYGLMRPAEVAQLTKAGCYLPDKGWGALTFGDSAPARARNGPTPARCTRNAGSKDAPAKLSARCRSRRSSSISCGSTSSASGRPPTVACSAVSAVA